MLSLHPSVGVARIGNSPNEIYLAPESIGGLPFDADANGNATGVVINFKDGAGLVKRQGQPFRIYNDDQTELTLDSPNVSAITWTVHLANKKAAWYQYSELKGNLLYGQTNSYTAQNVPWRNEKITGTARQELIVDPGPRIISGRDQSIGFDRASAPAGYPVQYPSEIVEYGTPIITLGNLLTDSKGRLVVLGGYGHAGGDEPLTSYGGSDTWHDDTSDGTVYCTVTFNDGTPDAELSAWVLACSPDFAPEIVNISNLSDTMFDVGVREFGLVPDMYNQDGWNMSYMANFKRDILPVINRISRYQWVSNVQSMMAFTANTFDFSDASQSNMTNRKNYFSYFRELDGTPPVLPPDEQPQQILFKENNIEHFPMMPLNSGSNSVSNATVRKFLALDATQYFLFNQWAEGLFTNNDPEANPFPVSRHNTASVGNCVGLPMCPGIEVTWSLQNKEVYSEPYVIYDRNVNYALTGLTPQRDECEGGGCEPGDLTKRMACPWQADFFLCTIQYINFTDPEVNKVEGMPKPPNYYSYWWPPQSPWDVLTGEVTPEGQAVANNPAGVQVNYARGINSFVQMVEHWSALGFLRNRNVSDAGFPYIVETERVNELFSYQDVPVGTISGNPEDDETTIPVFFIQQNKNIVKKQSLRGEKLVAHLEERAFKAIALAPEGLPLPRSGTRNRF
ncbi:L-lysine 6-oxidase [Chitinophaga sp. CF118]|uniref:CTQ-dependent lysine 6-oxidase LodA n=1 Tax=Chitinophaga sp. CF118 TaxID=1884367 RepID=UPI0008EE32A5|nr:CTQ-dependent lysine 6-oxidase LodA [Chitinophaga sp. CF118]SFE46695.1 L-lysine 6-oxidase [Chitinophaga sp. CF118]